MRRLLFISFSVLAAACSAPDATIDAPQQSLVGTWKLVEWREQDSLGVWQEEFGAEPRGYFVYGPSGFLSIHLMHEDGAEVTGCSADDVPGDLAGEGFLVAPHCYVGYFGSYRIENDSTVVHLPTGGTILGYIGTEQPRRFGVRGDSPRIPDEALMTTGNIRLLEEHGVGETVVSYDEDELRFGQRVRTNLNSRRRFRQGDRVGYR